MARNNFWNDVVAGMQAGQKMMIDADNAAFNARERERKEKEWEQQDAVDKALASAPSEVTQKSAGYKVNEEVFPTIEKAAEASAKINAQDGANVEILPVDAKGGSAKGWRDATRSDKYLSAVKTLQGSGYGLAADKVHDQYGKVVAAELDEAGGRAAVTGDWDSVMQIYNKKVGDGFEGRAEKLPDGKIAFYSKGPDGKEVLFQKFDDNAQAAAYVQSIAKNDALNYWKTAVVNREAAAQKLALQQKAQEDRVRHNEMMYALKLSGGGGGGSRGGSGGGSGSGKDPLNWDLESVNKAIGSFIPEKTDDIGISRTVDKKQVPVSRGELVSEMHQTLNAMQGAMPIHEAAPLAYNASKLRLSGASQVDKDGKRAPYAIEPVFSDGKVFYTMNDDRGRVYNFGTNRVIGDSELRQFNGGEKIIAARNQDMAQAKWNKFMAAEKSPESKAEFIKQYFNGDERAYEKKRAESLHAVNKFGPNAGVDRAVSDNENSQAQSDEYSAAFKQASSWGVSDDLSLWRLSQIEKQGVLKPDQKSALNELRERKKSSTPWYKGMATREDSMS